MLHRRLTMVRKPIKLRGNCRPFEGIKLVRIAQTDGNRCCERFRSGRCPRSICRSSRPAYRDLMTGFGMAPTSISTMRKNGTLTSTNTTPTCSRQESPITRTVSIPRSASLWDAHRTNKRDVWLNVCWEGTPEPRIPLGGGCTWICYAGDCMARLKKHIPESRSSLSDTYGTLESALGPILWPAGMSISYLE
jgi:hypothetical protein